MGPRNTKQSYLDSWAHLQNFQAAQQIWPDPKHGGGVIKLAAVVGRRKKGDEPSPGEELITILDYLSIRGIAVYMAV